MSLSAIHKTSLPKHWREDIELSWSISFRLLRTAVITALLLHCLSAPQQAVAVDFLELIQPELRQLREELAETEEAFAALSPMTVGQTCSEVGAQSHMWKKEPPVPRRIQLDLKRKTAVDSITIIPAFMSFAAEERESYAFPRAFRIDASNDPEFAEFDRVFETEDTTFESTHSIPFVVRTPGLECRYIRFTVLRMAQFLERYAYAISEIIVLSGNRNVAVDADVEMPDSPNIPPTWHPRNLVDARTPLGPPIFIGELPEFDGVYCRLKEDDHPNWMMVDLGDEFDIDEVRLHPIHSRQGAAIAGYAFPRQFVVSASKDREFSDESIIFGTGGKRFASPGDNPVIFPSRGVRGRYVKVLCVEPWEAVPRMGFSEIEVYSESVNVSRGKSASIYQGNLRSPDYLTDGFASYGKIIELPIWIDRLESYGRLLAQSISLRREVDSMQRHAERRRSQLIWCVIACLSLFLAAAFLVRRRHRSLEQRLFRIQLARDLHDEVGSNLAAIARLGEVAPLETDPAQVETDWRSTRSLALECTNAMRETLWLLGGREEPSEDLYSRLEAAAKRMLPDIELAWRDELPRDGARNERHDRELYLAFKEVLGNTARHSRATSVAVHLFAAGVTHRIEICDNGVGFEGQESQVGMGLDNVRRRISGLGGRVEFESRPGDGTTVRISIPS